jgi:hypothetical protein
MDPYVARVGHAALPIEFQNYKRHRSEFMRNTDAATAYRTLKASRMERLKSNRFFPQDLNLDLYVANDLAIAPRMDFASSMYMLHKSEDLMTQAAKDEIQCRLIKKSMQDVLSYKQHKPIIVKKIRKSVYLRVITQFGDFG